MKAPYCEDVRKVGDYEAAFVGVPFDTGTTYRPGTRFGPQAVRRISAVYDGYSVDGGVDLFEELDFCDAGDIFVIPGNIEKTFDQVSMAVSHIYTSGATSGAFPIICGGDHSLGYPNVRGVAPHIDGNVGIIHFDRHIDMQDMDMDERMHTTPWYWTSNAHEDVEFHGPRPGTGPATPTRTWSSTAPITTTATCTTSASPTARPRTWCRSASAAGTVRGPARRSPASAAPAS
jgi:agmatinase